MIDRYDGRGHLHSLQEHESAASDGFPTSEEAAEEAACEEER